MEELEFINREREKDYIIDSYTNNIIIIAPLGYGKSLLINHVAKKLKKKDFIHIDIKVKKDIELDKLKNKLEDNIKNIDIDSKLYITVDDIEETKKEIIEEFINRYVLKLEAKEIKVVLTTRRMINRLKLDKRFVERKMKAFDFDVIKEATRCYLEKKKKIDDIDLICKLSYNILYHTGGHPQCVNALLQEIVASDNIEGYFDNRDRTFSIVEKYSKIIIDNLTQDMRRVLPILSPIRKFNTQTLRVLIESGLIKYNIEEVFGLEDELTKTRIIERKDSFLQDNIIRKLLAINLRNNKREEYLNIIAKAKESHRYSIENRLSIFPHILGIELIFLEIEERLERGISGDKEYISELFSSTLELLIQEKSIDTKKAKKEVFIERLKEDSELECIVNFYINRESRESVADYEKIVKRLEYG